MKAHRKRAINLWYRVLRRSGPLRAIVAGVGRGLSYRHVVRVPAVRAGHGREVLGLAGDGLEEDAEALMALDACVAVVTGTARR